MAAYLREKDMQYLPDGMRRDLPFLKMRPNRLVEDLAAAFGRRDKWPQIGEAARCYVMKWHNPALIARAMVGTYRDPNSCFDFPAALSQPDR